MLLLFRSFSGDKAFQSVLAAAAALLLTVPAVAQQQPAPRLVYMSCAYVQGTVFYLTGNFSVPANQVGAAKVAFRQYAQSQSGNQVTNQACRVAPTEGALQAARQSDRSAVSSQSNQKARIIDIGWRYTATDSATAANPAPRYRQTASSITQNPAAQGSTAQSTSAQSAVPQTTSAQSTSGMTAGVAQAGQSMKDSAMSTGATITNNATQAATDATTQLQKSATDKLISFLHRQPKPAASQTQQTASTSAPATTGNNFLAGNSEPEPTSSARPTTPANSGPSFAACHAAAGPTEYVSEVFPVVDADDTKLRYAFWQIVARQHKAGAVPYSAVSCSRGTSEQEATGLRTAALEAASKRGVTAGQVVNTGWSYLGQ